MGQATPLVAFCIACNVLSGAFACVVYRYDLSYINSLSRKDAYEHAHLVAALQGLTNRNESTLYVELIDIDSTWLQFLTGRGEWLQDCRVINISSITDLVATFRSSFEGVVLYDPNVASTSLVASTIAGADNLLPICQRDEPGSLYRALVLGGPRLPVRISLVNRFDGRVTGSKKCDAYVWAIQNYIQTGRSNCSVMGYLIDYYWTSVTTVNQPYFVNTVTNHDFVIARKGFFWDLDVWPTDAPNDDPTQPVGTDYKTLNSILLAAYSKIQNKNMIHVVGFTPWAFKYITTEHGGVATEWQTAKILSAYNAFIDADACCINSMTSASFFQHYPLASRHVQNPKPTSASLIRDGYLRADGSVVPRTYLMFYVGDYDSAAWLYSQLKSKWDDPARGSVPLGWAIDPNLSQRFPVIFDYMFRSLTPADRIITGDSGPGYINPTQLFVPREISGLPSGAAVWVGHAQPYYKQFDISFTGFIINGACGPMTDSAERLYSEYLSPDGMVEQTGYGPEGKGIHLQGTTPVFYEEDLPQDITQAAQAIKANYKSGALQFQVYRAILVPPSYFKGIMQLLQGLDIVAVDPLVLSALARIHLGSSTFIATW